LNMAWSAIVIPNDNFINWQEVSVNTQMIVGADYLSSGNINLNLPLTAQLGDSIKISNASGNFTITQNAGQTIHFGGVDTTTGVAGSITSLNANAIIQLICTVADTDWTVSSDGNFTIA